MERIVRVVPEAGLHARPASQVVRTANGFDAAVTLEAIDGDAPPASATSMLGVTGLNVKQGERVRVVAEGSDAEAALDAIESILTESVEDGDGDSESETDGDGADDT
ncbi:HPr family phosphocarrier protein [Halorubrum vacuolatum]|uniref:Phosphocarrier protein HPr n=1 Tax=Halorubrum vacuolatum TaxID=63740 RepID=A0A238W1H2_HALVU|nr:HPr family phosphocarrier protein [Halorubrum vacuolatum]SNR40204.1 Phosphocarrier protein HPr [Halorubrum vacuolatum]